MENVYLGRQPVLDLYEDLTSYEILYREGFSKQKGVSNRYVSAAVLSSLLNKFGTYKILGNRKAFVKVDENFLMNDLIFTIPNNFFIFSIVHVDLNEKIIERFEQLKEKGYTLAVNDVSINEESLQQYVNVLETLTYVKIDFDKEFTESSSARNIISALNNYGIEVVATKIETREEFELAKDMGCNLFQGYFFAKPEIFENSNYDASQVNILKLYTMLMEDTNIDEITAAFEENHEITLQLLQYVNSCTFHFRNKVSSIHHILTLVGRAPLAQWLMLMIYSKSVSANGSKVSPLMLMVKHRTELMECILKQVSPNVRSNTLGQAYFIGVLSLIDTIFGEKLEIILNDMNIDDIVKDAILDSKGELGEIFALVKDIESFNTHGIDTFIKKHNLDESMIAKLSLQSMEEVTLFENALNPSEVAS